jgi:hypothetical protein
MPVSPALPLSVLISSIAASPAPRLRQTITTLAPILANPKAVALPIPELAPVTMRTLPTMEPPPLACSIRALNRYVTAPSSTSRLVLKSMRTRSRMSRDHPRCVDDEFAILPVLVSLPADEGMPGSQG